MTGINRERWGLSRRKRAGRTAYCGEETEAGSGAVIGAVAVARDATGRYLEERRLKERLAALEKPAR